MSLPIGYSVRIFCNKCGGTGLRPDGSVYPPVLITCESCGGDGYIDDRWLLGGLSEAFIEVTDKIQEVKTKINQMQADINYIKMKVE